MALVSLDRNEPDYTPPCRIQTYWLEIDAVNRDADYIN